MRRSIHGLAILALLVLLPAAATAQQRTLTCVGLYSETGAGYVSQRVGTAAWTPIKVGDVIPANAQIRINVDRDWVELIVTGAPNAVYELTGSSSGEVMKSVADILKLAPRTVVFPAGTADKPDGAYQDKLVVTQYLGRQIYINSANQRKDIKYGDVLERTGKVRIIAINNTLTLMNSNGAVTTVIGPLNFDVDAVLSNRALYKFLNVQR